MQRFLSFASILVSVAVLSLGCEMFNKDKDKDDDVHRAHAGQQTGKVAMATLKPAAASTTQPSMQNVTGTLTFTELDGNRVHVTGEIKGLTTNTEHGFHIHEKGDLSAPDLSSAGAHFNPTGAKHGSPHSAERHAGDFGNIRSDTKGIARVDGIFDGVSLQGTNSIVGKSVIVHAKPDDLRTDPSGNAGGRVAGGVIEMKK